VDAVRIRDLVLFCAVWLIGTKNDEYAVDYNARVGIWITHSA
jgi:hypothetical protein